jgi:RNA polymerase sigma-70 factor (ECF subfamily)
MGRSAFTSQIAPNSIRRHNIPSKCILLGYGGRDKSVGPHGPGLVAQLLQQWRSGDQQALEQLIPLVYTELQRIAHRHLRRERGGHTLQTTALVNEAYLRLVNDGHVEWQNRAHFLGVAAGLMRQILVDYARHVSRKKRGGGAHYVPLDEGMAFVPAKSEELIALDAALVKLAAVDPRKTQVVLRYFGGLDVEQTAEVLSVHPNTVIRDWPLAKVWLKRELTGRAGADAS